MLAPSASAAKPSKGKKRRKKLRSNRAFRRFDGKSLCHPRVESAGNIEHLTKARALEQARRNRAAIAALAVHRERPVRVQRAAIHLPHRFSPCASRHRQQRLEPPPP